MEPEELLTAVEQICRRPGRAYAVPIRRRIEPRLFTIINACIQDAPTSMRSLAAVITALIIKLDRIPSNADRLADVSSIGPRSHAAAEPTWTALSVVQVLRDSTSGSSSCGHVEQGGRQ